MTAFSVATEIHPDRAQLVVTGPLDMTTIDRLAQHSIDQLLEPAAPVLVIDLGQVPFIDSMGLGALVRVRNVARHVGKQLLLIHVPPCVQRQLDITGLDVYFEQQLGDTAFGIDTFLRTAPLDAPRGASLDGPGADHRTGHAA